MQTKKLTEYPSDTNSDLQGLFGISTHPSKVLDDALQQHEPTERELEIQQANEDFLASLPPNYGSDNELDYF